MRAPRRWMNPGPRSMRGLAAVELALVVPLFLFLLVGTEELGRALYQYNTLTKTVRDGAQYMARKAAAPGTGIVDLTTSDNINNIATTKNLVVYGKPTATTGQELLPGMSTDNVTVAATTLGAGRVSITVTATYTFSSFYNFPVFGIGTGIASPGTLTAAVTMVAL